MSEQTFKAITEEEIRAIGAYEIVEHRFLEDYHTDSYVLRHVKSGARIALLPNEDTNKVFFTAFRTPPTDSTGVAHIIEHTVLCGSRDFPIKDPFIEVAKGSLNTFLNAMTYPDKTVYPVASTNEKDFANLMHVYLDAVFHPNIYANENIFRQEGWHYEAAEEPFALKINGVVYNEMKGVMSNPDDILADKVMASLFPDTTYSIVSGGDPEVIPDLTYADYLAFHSRYYHPSNSYIYLYGDMDMAERLDYLDKAYLSDYDVLDIDSTIHTQALFTAPVEATYPYAVEDGAETAGQTYLSYNYYIPVDGDPKRNLAFKILDYVLCDAEGAPVKEAVRKAGIGEEVSSLYEAGVRQPFYMITAKYANPEDKSLFLKTIDDRLADLAENGIDEKSLLAGINYYEFQYREADFGTYPKGLVLGLDAMDTWLYDEESVWTNLEVGRYFDELKASVREGYFEQLLREVLIENPHKSVVLLEPQPGLTKEMEDAQTARLQALAASMSEADRQAVRDAEASLRAWQETPDTAEDMATIPVLSRSDLTREERPFINREFETRAGKIKVLAHPVFTSGIDYVNLVFDITRLPRELYPTLAMFKTLLGALDTSNYSYAELDHEINIVTGGIGQSIGTYTQTADPSQYKVTFEVHMKAMHGNYDAAMDLIYEILRKTQFTDLVRIREVLEEERSGLKADLPASGHSTAATRAASYYSRTARISDDMSGIGYYRTLDALLEKGLDASFTETMNATARWIFRQENLLFDITADEAAIQELLPRFDVFANRLRGLTMTIPAPDHATELDLIADLAATVTREMGIKRPWENVTPDEVMPYVTDLEQRNEGFTTAGQIQFVCRAGNYRRHGLRYTGALRVLKVIEAYDYLWRNIRMKGGAYGCMSGFGRDGSAYFVTYRDPHLAMSIDTFEQAADYIADYEADETTMTKYVIGAISTLDKPMSPSMLGRYSLSAYMTGLTMAELQEARDQVLDCTVSDIRALADVIKAFMRDGNLVVIGNGDKIREHKELFKNIAPLC